MSKANEDFKYYNANDKDRDTGDCVKRSLSLAYNIPYKQVAKELNDIKRTIRSAKFNTYPVFTKYIKDKGYIDSIDYKSSEAPTVAEFADSNNTGRFIVLCGSKAGYGASHMVCIIDGTIYDSWDSSNYYVDFVYIISKDITSLNDGAKDNDNDLYKKATEICKATITKWSNKYKLLDYYTLDSYDSFGYYDNNTLKMNINYKINPVGFSELNQTIVNRYRFSKSFDIIVKFSPYMSMEEREKHLEDAIITQVRANLYKLKYQLDKIRKEQDLQATSDVNTNYNPKWMEKEFNQLPNWVKSRVVRFIYDYSYNEDTDRDLKGYELVFIATPEMTEDIKERLHTYTNIDFDNEYVTIHVYPGPSYCSGDARPSLSNLVSILNIIYKNPDRIGDFEYYDYGFETSIDSIAKSKY